MTLLTKNFETKLQVLGNIPSHFRWINTKYFFTLFLGDLFLVSYNHFKVYV